MADLGKTSSGMQPNFAAMLSYVLGLITGLIFFLTEKENQFVRFHAMQSICFSVAMFVVVFVVSIVPVIGAVIGLLLNLATIVVWVICMVQAYQGQWFRLPVIGDVAAKQAGVSS